MSISFRLTIQKRSQNIAWLSIILQKEEQLPMVYFKNGTAFALVYKTYI